MNTFPQVGTYWRALSGSLADAPMVAQAGRLREFVRGPVPVRRPSRRIEIAGLLYEGRMDGENATMCRVPRAHTDVATNVDTFARFAKDQYNDVVVLLAALSGKLKSSADDYTHYDADVQERMNSFLRSGCYIAAEDR